MRIEWVMACRSFENTPEGPILSGVGISERYDLRPGESVVLVMAVILVDSFINLLEPMGHRLKTRITDPNLREIRDSEEVFTVFRQTEREFPAGWEGRNILKVTVEFPADTEGTYVLEFRVDGGEPWTVAHLCRFLDQT